VSSVMVAIKRDEQNAVINVYVGDCLHRFTFKTAASIGECSDLVEWAVAEHNDTCNSEEERPCCG
jgi:hypothetical protein